MNEALLSSSLFAPMVALVALLALAAPFQVLLMLDLALVFLPGHWLVGGVRVDPGDLVIGGILLALVLRGRRGGERGWWRVPGIGLWAVLGVVLCAAYLVAPENQPNLTTPMRIGYQLYRYCWRPILYYPLAVMLLGDSRRAWWVLDAVLLGGNVCAAIAVPQGYHGLRAAGPFESPNTLGAVLVVPMLVAIAGLLSEEGRGRKLMYAASLLLIGRSMLFCGSRGALMAVCLGTALLLWQASRHLGSRRRLLRFAPWALAGALAAVAIHPGLLHGPNVERFLTLTHPMNEDTLQWRMKLRWPHFWHKVEAHPWLGVGSYVDLSLGTSGNTPHNGYLAQAVMSGLPAALLVLGFGGTALWRALRRLKRARETKRARDPLRQPNTLRRGDTLRQGQGANPSPPAPAAEYDWLLDALVAAALAGLLVHNFDDTVLLIPGIGKELWLLVALGLAPPRAAVAAAAAGAAKAAAGFAPRSPSSQGTPGVPGARGSQPAQGLRGVQGAPGAGAAAAAGAVRP